MPAHAHTVIKEKRGCIKILRCSGTHVDIPKILLFSHVVADHMICSENLVVKLKIISNTSILTFLLQIGWILMAHIIIIIFLTLAYRAWGSRRVLFLPNL